MEHFIRVAAVRFAVLLVLHEAVPSSCSLGPLELLVHLMEHYGKVFVQWIDLPGGHFIRVAAVQFAVQLFFMKLCLQGFPGNFWVLGHLLEPCGIVFVQGIDLPGGHFIRVAAIQFAVQFFSSS